MHANTTVIIEEAMNSRGDCFGDTGGVVRKEKGEGMI